jgi:hypothetical protein
MHAFNAFFTTHGTAGRARGEIVRLDGPLAMAHKKGDHVIRIARSVMIAGLAGLLAACNSSSGSTTPSGPNAKSTTVTVTNASGARLGEIPVTLSTGIVNKEPSGVISSQPTNSVGQVTFSNLPGFGQLCVYAATTNNDIVYRTNHCATAFPSSYTLKFSFKD